MNQRPSLAAISSLVRTRYRYLNRLNFVAAAVPGVVGEQEVDGVVVGVDLRQDRPKKVDVELEVKKNKLWLLSRQCCSIRGTY